MGKITLKKIGIGLLSLAILALPSLVLALDDPFGVNYGLNAGLGTGDVRNVVVSLINFLLNAIPS